MVYTRYNFKHPLLTCTTANPFAFAPTDHCRRLGTPGRNVQKNVALQNWCNSLVPLAFLPVAEVYPRQALALSTLLSMHTGMSSP
jgi:hypothetical protein